MPIEHGIKIFEPITGARAITTVASAVIGLIATAGAVDADAIAALDAAFPLNEPVLVTDIRTAIDKAGTTGTLRQALEAIADQCTPTLIIIRAAIGDEDEDTEGNVIAAFQQLLTAESVTGVRPRILGAPGLDTLAVTTAMIPIAQKLRGFIYARAIGEDVAEANIYGPGLSARELMLIWPDFSDWNGSAVARALGLRARIDEETGWHKTLSNVTVNGVTGVVPPVHFDLLDSDTDAGALNGALVTTLVRMDGFRFWGNRTRSDEPAFAFESAVRTAQILQDSIAYGLRWAIDKPMTATLVKDILETINAAFRSLQAQGRIVGAVAWFDPSLNSQSDLAAGKLAIRYKFTPCAPAELISLYQEISDVFYANLGSQLGVSA